MKRTKIVAYPFGDESIEAIGEVIEYPNFQTVGHALNLLDSLKGAIEQTPEAKEHLEIIGMDEHPLCTTLNNASEILHDLYWILDPSSHAKSKH